MEYRIVWSLNGWTDGELVVEWMVEDLNWQTKVKAAGETQVLLMDGHLNPPSRPHSKKLGSAHSILTWSLHSSQSWTSSQLLSTHSWSQFPALFVPSWLYSTTMISLLLTVPQVLAHMCLCLSSWYYYSCLSFKLMCQIAILNLC